MSIIDHCPEGFTLRDNQIKILRQVETHWNRFDVLVIPASVGSGKSLIAQTIARWRAAQGETTATITPKVSLQDQYRDSFPSVPTLKGKARYSCKSDKNMSCADHYDIYENYCKGCVYKTAKAKVSESANAVFNFQSYILGKMYKENLILDEAHNVFPVMGDMFSTVLWRHKHKYPSKLNDLGDAGIWLEKAIKSGMSEIITLEKKFKVLRGGQAHKVPKDLVRVHKNYKELRRNVEKYKTVLAGIQAAPTNFYMEHDEDMYRGSMKDCLKIRPTTLMGMPALLWPPDITKKIVLMSGTISEVDISYMGLNGMKVKYLQTDNPIPAENRPLIVDNTINMAWKYQQKNVPKMAEKLAEIMDTHPNGKGIIHTTYGLASKFKPLMKDNKRILWHDKDNKEEVLDKFLKSKEPVVMMACGFAEGLDLAGEIYEFQIISKIQWPSKADKFIDYLYTHHIERIVWDTVRIVIQQSGRICRSANDKGITYIVDASFGNVLKKRQGLFQRSYKFWGKDIIEAIEWR